MARLNRSASWAYEFLSATFKASLSSASVAPTCIYFTKELEAMENSMPNDLYRRNAWFRYLLAEPVRCLPDIIDLSRRVWAFSLALGSLAGKPARAVSACLNL